MSDNTCKLCERLTSKGLAQHKYRFHKKSVVITINDTPKTFDRDDNELFTCDVCAMQINETENFKRHVQRHHGKQLKTDDYDLYSDDVTIEDPAISQPMLQRTEPKLSVNVKVQSSSTITRRNAKTAILSAMHALHEPKDIQRQKLLVAELGKLQPIGIIRNGLEHNFLADSNTISSVMETEDPLSPVFHSVPKYHSSTQDETNICHTTLLPNHIVIHQIQKLISKDSYVEMNEELSAILNTDWNRYPWIRYVCARMMEGVLLLDSGKGVMICCAEVYGRTPEHDAHHEKIKSTKTQVLPSSLPRPFTRYSNIEVQIVKNDNSCKLILGSKTMNVLITSSVRVDTVSELSLGPSSSNGFEPSPSTFIFVSKQFINWYLSTTFDAGYKQLYIFDELSQLRQVRSKFCFPSTYLLCRSSSVFTNDTRCRPATLWTLSDFDTSNGNTSVASLVSRLFRAIATSVLDHGKDATLKLETVETIISKLKDGPDKKIFQSLINQFSDLQEIPILGNQNLNGLLTQLAGNLTTAISNVNNKLARNVHDIFYNNK